MRTKTLLKIQLRNKGIEVKPSCYLPNGRVITSYALPKRVMRKLKELDIEYRYDQITLFKEMLNNFNFQVCPVEDVWFSDELLEYIEDNQIELSKKTKKADWRFNSKTLPEKMYIQIKDIAAYYNITRSSLIRVLIEKFYKDKLGI